MAVIVFMHRMWVCGLQLIIFCFFGCASFFTLGWVCIKGLFVCWRVVGCLGQHCVLFVDHHLPRVNALIVCLWLWLVWCVRTV